MFFTNNLQTTQVSRVLMIDLYMHYAKSIMELQLTKTEKEIMKTILKYWRAWLLFFSFFF